MTGLFRALPALALLLAGCAGSGPVLQPALGPGFAATELSATPFFPQEDYQCGPAALATVLNVAGVAVSPDDLAPAVYIPERRGSLQLELLGAARRHDRLPYPLEGDLAAIAAELQAGRPVLVLQNLGFRRLPVWHYAVVVGLDPAQDEVTLRSGAERRLVMEAGKFLESWEKAGSWAIVVLEPGELPARPDENIYLRAAAGLESAGRYGAALEAYRAGLGRWPESTLARLGVANSLHALGRKRQAESEYRALLELDSANGIAWNNYGSVLNARGCRAAALAAVENAIASGPASLLDAFRQTREEIIVNQAPAPEPGSCPPAI